MIAWELTPGPGVTSDGQEAYMLQPTLRLEDEKKQQRVVSLPLANDAELSGSKSST